ncbi:MAG: NUDIX hydrolase [Synechococcales bacterium]|nr:NUDIX hydrolase [Synechococcales bacterium]
MEPNWLRWAQELQAIAQTGLHFSKDNPFDIARYQRLREIAAEMMAVQGSLDAPALLELLHREEGYATPKVDVRGAVFQQGRILMVKEISDGRWTLPGGWADVGDAPREAVVREIWEESGYEARPVKLLAVYDRSKHPHQPFLPFHIYKLFIQCELTGGQAQTSIETSDVGFFAEDELPELSISRITEAQIHRLFEHYRNPDLPTDFD